MVAPVEAHAEVTLKLEVASRGLSVPRQNSILRRNGLRLTVKTMADLPSRLAGIEIYGGWEMVAHREEPVKRIAMSRQARFRSVLSTELRADHADSQAARS